MVLTITLVAYSVLFITLLIISIIDCQTMRIPNSLIAYGISIGITYRILQAFYIKDIKIFFHGIVGFIVGASMIAIIILFSLTVFKKEGMGMGDLKLLAMIGLFIGSKKVFYTIFIAIIVGGIYAVIVLIKSKKEIFPFGPFLSGGAVVAIVWGDALWQLYMNLIGI